jgi:hypothetical protein
MKGASLTLKALGINILGSTTIEVEDEIMINVRETANINSSHIRSKNTAIITMEDGASMHIKTSIIIATNLFGIMAVKMGEGSSLRVYLTDSVFTSKAYSFESVTVLNFTGMTLKGGLLEIKDSVTCVLGILFDAQKSPSKVLVEDSSFRLSDYYIIQAGPSQVMQLINCKGTFNVQYNDNESPASIFKLFLRNSKMTLYFDAVSDRKIQVTSDNSLGSQIISKDEIVNISPDIESPDRASFERLTAAGKYDAAKVQYGYPESISQI